MRYICMPRFSGSTSPPRNSVGFINVCPTCGATCWDREVPKEIEGKPHIKLCTECAIRKVTGKPQVRRCG